MKTRMNVPSSVARPQWLAQSANCSDNPAIEASPLVYYV
jgi:hypothetical protein